MAKSPAYYWRTLLWTLMYYRPEYDVIIETENGVLSVSNKDWLIGKHLFARREYEIDFIRQSMAFLQSKGFLKTAGNKTVCDIGANLGMISIALLREGFFENAIAFEPSPQNFRLLKKNAAQNGFAEKMKCFPIALSSADADIEFEIAADNSGDSRVRKTSKPGDMNEHLRQTVTVQAKSFDSFAEEFLTAGEQEQIGLFWIDIQGHEGHFFKGAKEFFRRRKIPVINEFWGYGINRSGMRRDEYCQIIAQTFDEFYILTENGYQLRSISEIDRLFDRYRKPREIANIILV